MNLLTCNTEYYYIPDRPDGTQSLKLWNDIRDWLIENKEDWRDYSDYLHTVGGRKIPTCLLVDNKAAVILTIKFGARKASGLRDNRIQW